MSNPNRTSLFSKIKTCIANKRITAILFTAITLTIIALALVVVYGSLAGWNFSEILTSHSAMLVYALIAITILILVIRFCNRRG